MNKIIFLVFLFTSRLLFAQDCQYQFNQNQINVNFTGEEITAYFNIDVQRPNSGSPADVCDRVAIFFSRGNAQSYNRKVFKNGQGMNYTLENINPTGTLKNLGDQSGDHEFLSTYISRGQNKTLTGLFKMPAQNLPSGSGHYQDVVVVSIYGYKNANNYRAGLVKQLVVNVQTQQRMDLSIVPEGGIFDGGSTSAVLDYGQLEDDEELGADLIIKSNIGYQVKVSSQNNGKLKNYATKSKIAYAFKFDGRNTRLGGTSGNPRVVVTKSGGSISSGDRYNMRFRIKQVGNSPVGYYFDNVMVTVSSQ